VTKDAGSVETTKAEVVAIRSDEQQKVYDAGLDRLKKPHLTDLWSGMLDTGLSLTRGSSSTVNSPWRRRPSAKPVAIRPPPTRPPCPARMTAPRPPLHVYIERRYEADELAFVAGDLWRFVPQQSALRDQSNDLILSTGFRVTFGKATF
jgi:hypothetical protein